MGFRVVLATFSRFLHEARIQQFLLLRADPLPKQASPQHYLNGYMLWRKHSERTEVVLATTHRSVPRWRFAEVPHTRSSHVTMSYDLLSRQQWRFLAHVSLHVVPHVLQRGTVAKFHVAKAAKLWPSKGA